MFLVGAAPALLVFYIGRQVQESPVWREREAVKAQVAAQVKTSLASGIRQFAPTFIFLVLLMTCFNAFSHGTQDLYPTFLEKGHHFSATLTGVVGIIYNVGALLGGVFFGGISERFGRKRTIITAALLSLPVIPLYALAHSLIALASGAFLMQFMVQGAWGVVPAYLSELSPGPMRAIFPGLAYQLGNLITSRNAVLQARAAERFGGFGRVLAVTVLLVASCLALVTYFGRESRGTDITV